MLAAGVPPDHITYSAVLAAAERAKDADAALRLLDRMHASGAAAPGDAYARVIDMLASAGRWGDAVELFLTLQLAGADPTRGTVVALAAALAAGGPPAARSAAQLFDAVRASRPGDVAMTAAALGAVAATCPWTTTAAAWARAKRAGAPPTRTGAAALVACAEAGGMGGEGVAALRAEIKAVEARAAAAEAEK